MLSIRRLVLLLGALLPAALGIPAAPHVGPETIPGKFIVTLKPSDSIHLDSHLQWVQNIHGQSAHKRSTAGAEKTYNFNKFMAYAGEFDPQTIEKIKASPDVADVSPDYIMHLADVVEEKRSSITQNNAPWGLGTISHRDPGSTSYVYDDSAGMRTYAYVVDSGVLTTHVQLEGRASLGYNAIVGVAHEDRIGHGTHVAGTIASKSYGVVKKANIISVKVFDTGSTTVSVFLDGFNWAVNDIKDKERSGRSVINMSLGGPVSQVWDIAINAAWDFGIAVVVAGGNGDPLTGKPVPVSTQSPANVANATTVAAMDAAWAIATFTNFGPGVDVFGPGVGVLSLWIGASNTATAVLSGTSMAAPHISGLLLYMVVYENLKNSAAATVRLSASGTRNKLLGTLNGSPNIVAYNGAA